MWAVTSTKGLHVDWVRVRVRETGDHRARVAAWLGLGLSLGLE